MAFAFVAGSTYGNLSAGTTSPGVDTTGANLIVVVKNWSVGGATGGQNPLIEDSKSNSYTGGTAQVNATQPQGLFGAIDYKENPAVGSGTTWSIGVHGASPVIAVSLASGAYSGAATPTCFDQYASANAGSGTSVGCGTLTASVDGSLFVIGGGWLSSGSVTTPAGYTLDENIISDLATYYTTPIAHATKNISDGAQSPSWSWVGSSSENVGVMAVFKPAAGGGRTVSGAANDNADATSGSVKVAVKASGGATETNDASAGNITASQGYHISGAANEGADASSGSLKVAVHISGGTTEAADASAGNITATARTISGGATETADVSSGSLHNANPLPLPVQQGMGPGWNLFHHQPARVREHDSVEDDIRRILAKAEEAQSPKAKRQAVKELRSVVGEAVAKADDSFKATAQTLERAMRLEMSADAFLRNVSSALEKQRIQDSDDMEAFMIIAELAA